MPISFTWAVCILLLFSRQVLKLLLLWTISHPKRQLFFSSQRATVIPKPQSSIHSTCQSVISTGHGAVTLGACHIQVPFLNCAGTGALFLFAAVRNKTHGFDIWFGCIRWVCKQHIFWDMLGSQEKKKALMRLFSEKGWVPWLMPQDSW